MQLEPFATQVAEQLRAAAALGDDRTREVAAALAEATGPVVRLALLQAVAQAADEITAQLLDLPGSPAVGVHLDGEELAVQISSSDTAPTEDARRDEGEPTARISLRLSDALKAQIDAAAERDGVSVNTWLVRAASAAVRGSTTTNTFDAGGRWDRRSQSRVTGWING